MEEELLALLAADAAVAALVGTRIEWGARRQGAAMPDILLRRIGGGPGETLAGTDGLVVTRVQVDCYAATYAQALAVGRAVEAALHAHRGGGFQGVFLAGRREEREGGTNEADRPFRQSLDFIVNWSET